MMEFTSDEIARLIAVLKRDLRYAGTRGFYDCPVDFLTPISKLQRYFEKAYFEGDKILYIGIKD